MTHFAYWRPATPGQGQAAQPELRALKAWAEASGVDIELRPESDMARPTRLAERAVGGPVLRMLAAGDTLVVPSFASAFDYPSDVPETVRKVAGRGAMLRVLGLEGMGPIEVVSAIAGAFQPLEAEVARLTGELEVVQADAERRLAAARAETVRVLADRLDSFTADLPELGDIREGQPDVHAGEHIGVALGRRAERLGLSQSEIARRLDIPFSSVNRGFREGKGSAVESIARLLWPEAPKPEPQRESWQREPDGAADGAAALSTFKEGV